MASLVSEHRLYPRLFSPLKVGTVQLKNRVIMGAMHTRLDTVPNAIARRVAFCAERVRGEAAPIFTGGYSATPNHAGITEPELLDQHSMVKINHNPKRPRYHNADQKCRERKGDEVLTRCGF